MRASLRYRALHEIREAKNLSGPVRTKIKVLCYFVLLPSAVMVAYQTCRYLFTISEAALPVVVPGMILIGTFYYFIIASELFMEISFTPDLALLRISPISSAEILGSRLFFAGVRLVPLHLSVMVYPAAVIMRLPTPGTSPIVLFAWAVVFFGWIQMLSLRTAVGLAEVSGKKGIQRETISAGIFAAGMIGISPAGYTLVDSAAWRWWQHAFWWAGTPDAALYASGAAFIFSAAWLYRDSLRHWAAASISPEASRVANACYPAGATFFSESPWVAVFQKDRKDLLRNPAYRNALLACIVLLTIALLAQWKAGDAGGPSARRMTTALALLYLVPMLVSARSISVERRMLGFYRLVLPDAAKLLDWKLQAQVPANCLICSILALPLFLLVGGGVDPHEPLHYAVAVVFCVPLLTMLALTLGTYFPTSSIHSNPIGFRIPGLVLYVVPAVVLYSLLLSRMYATAALYLPFLASATLALYLCARRRLHSL